MNYAEIRIGIVGFGSQGSTYAAQLHNREVEGLRLTAVTCPDASERQEVNALFPSVSVYANATSMFESGEIDAAVVTVPHYLHPSVSIDALKHGLHVLVEKPVGVYTKQVEELNAVADSHPHLTFAAMFNQRTNPVFQNVRDLVSSGSLGDIRHTSWTVTTWWRPQSYYQGSSWRGTWGGEGGGLLVNQAPHQLDLWQWICGLPVSLYAKVGYGYKRDISVDDDVNVLADFGQGATGVFRAAVHDLVGVNRLEVLCDEGKVVVEDSSVAKVYRFDKDEETISREFRQSDVKDLLGGKLPHSRFYSEEVFTSDSRWGSEHLEILRNFADNIINGTPLLADGREGLASVRLANAIYLSSWREEPVPLDFDDEEFLHLLDQRIRAEGLYNSRVR